MNENRTNRIAALVAFIGLVLVLIGLFDSPLETWEKLLVGGIIAIALGLVILDDELEK